MKVAKAMRYGGELIEAADCDYDDFKKLIPLCPECSEPVYLKAGSDRTSSKGKAYKIPKHWSHFDSTSKEQRASCEARVSGYTEKDRQAIASKARGQRLKWLQRWFWTVLETNSEVFYMSNRSDLSDYSIAGHFQFTYHEDFEFGDFFFHLQSLVSVGSQLAPMQEKILFEILDFLSTSRQKSVVREMANVYFRTASESWGLLSDFEKMRRRVSPNDVDCELTSPGYEAAKIASKDLCSIDWAYLFDDGANNKVEAPDQKMERAYTKLLKLMKNLENKDDFVRSPWGYWVPHTNGNGVIEGKKEFFPFSNATLKKGEVAASILCEHKCNVKYLVRLTLSAAPCLSTQFDLCEQLGEEGWLYLDKDVAIVTIIADDVINATSINDLKGSISSNEGQLQPIRFAEHAK